MSASVKNIPPLYTATGSINRTIHTENIPSSEVTTCDTDNDTGVTTCTSVPVYKKPIITGKTSSLKSIRTISPERKVVVETVEPVKKSSVRTLSPKREIIIETVESPKKNILRTLSPKREIIIETAEPPKKNTIRKITSVTKSASSPVRLSPGRPGVKVQEAPIIIDEEESDSEEVEIEESDDSEVEIDINVKKVEKISNLRGDVNSLKEEVDAIQRSENYNRITDIDVAEEKYFTC